MKPSKKSNLASSLGQWSTLALAIAALSGCGGESSNNNNTPQAQPPAVVAVDPNAAFNDEAAISDYAKKSVLSLKSQGLLPLEASFQPQSPATQDFAGKLLSSQTTGTANLTFDQAKQLILDKFIAVKEKEVVSVEGFLSKKDKGYQDTVTREEFAYMVSQAQQANFVATGEPIHNPAIASPGPLLGPTVFQSGTEGDTPIYDGSTISLFHRAKQGNNTTFGDNPLLTLQVHPEVFKSVSAGGIAVENIQELAALLEVELADGTLHKTPLTSMVPFSIHGADGKKGVIRIEDGILVLVDDLLGYVDEFELNGHPFTKLDVVNKIQSQHYYNGEVADTEVTKVVTDELTEKGFSLQDRRLMLHNMILAKTALQQAGLSGLSAPFNTIAGGSSASRSFTDGHLYTTYQLVQTLIAKAKADGDSAIRSDLNSSENQQNLLTGTKILTAATLLPHISSLANAPFLPNEALSSRVKKSGALLPSEPVVFQFDRLKRAAYILLDDALSQGTASHFATHGEIIKNNNASEPAFSLSAGNFTAEAIQIKESVLMDALYDFKQSYESLINLISGVNFADALTDLAPTNLNNVVDGFSRPIMNDQMSRIKIGGLTFKMDMLATPSHLKDSFAPVNDLTSGRSLETFGLADALQPFPTRLASYICEGKVVSNSGDLIDDAKLNPAEQQDLIQDISATATQQCLTELGTSPRYKQLLFVDNFQLPPFGPTAKFISTQGIEIINRILLSPENSELDIADIRLTYRLNKDTTTQSDPQ